MTKDTSKMRWLRRGLIAVFILAVLYVASFAPACSFTVRGQIPNAPVYFFYKPIPGRLQTCLLQLWTHIDPKVALALNGER